MSADVTGVKTSAASVPSAGYTPGPWHVTDGGGSVYALDESGQVNRFYINVQPGYVVRTRLSSTSVHTPYSELDANARLISAAPELLEALIGVVRVADRKTDEFDAARAAIEKATGAA
jgi:hypothetical protein